jgi:ribonuclease HI
MAFDGGCSGNPGPMGVGVYIINEDEPSETYSIAEHIGDGTNNIAEYSALIRGLSFLLYELRLKDSHIPIIGDSMLVIRQVNNEFSVNSSSMVKYWEKVNSLLTVLRKDGKNIITVRYEAGEFHNYAHRLTQTALAPYKKGGNKK